jgi:cohesin loading factor subunit SCC2
MQTLTVFAKANAKLFTPEQLMLLEPYIENLTSNELHVFRSVIVIYRYALSILTHRQSNFLQGVQSSLLKSLTRLPAPELREVISCLWTIGSILNAPDRLARVTISCLTNVRKVDVGRKPMQGEAEVKRVVRTLFILGLFGHYCDFEDQLSTFRNSFPDWEGNSVSGFITESIIPFSAPGLEPAVRRAAVESLGHVCQTHAAHFLKSKVIQIFDKIFKDGDKELKKLVISGLKGFLSLEETRSLVEHENNETKPKKSENVDGPRRLTQAAHVNSNDGVSTTLAQKYLKDIISISLASQDSHALVATEVITSILRQGLVHPKEVRQFPLRRAT